MRKKVWAVLLALTLTAALSLPAAAGGSTAGAYGLTAAAGCALTPMAADGTAVTAGKETVNGAEVDFYAGAAWFDLTCANAEGTGSYLVTLLAGDDPAPTAENLRYVDEAPAIPDGAGGYVLRFQLRPGALTAGAYRVYLTRTGDATPTLAAAFAWGTPDQPAPVQPSQPATRSHVITAEAGEGGSVTPAGRVSVTREEDQTFTFTPEDGYEVADVLADGVSQGAADSYTFENVRADHTLTVTFRRAQPVNPFADVEEGTFYYDAVLWAAARGITVGSGSHDHFGPKDPCTRGQIVTFLWRAMGSPEPVGTVQPFDDLVPGAYYYKAALWAAEQGIAQGYGGRFDPDGPCNRAQAVTFLSRAAGAAGAGETGFSDVPAGAYYEAAVAWAVENGITNGVGGGLFGPDGGCDRAQIVTMLYRWLAEGKDVEK